MEETRKIAHAPRSAAVAAEIPKLRGPCVACADCEGLCAELIEVLTLPEVIVRKGGRPKKDGSE